MGCLRHDCARDGGTELTNIADNGDMVGFYFDAGVHLLRSFGVWKEGMGAPGLLEAVENPNAARRAVAIHLMAQHI